MNAQLARTLRYAGLLLLVVLIWLAGPRQLIEAARQADARWLLLAWLLNVPQVGLKAWRWSQLLAWQGIRFRWARAQLAYFGGLFVGFLTPGRVGEMTKAITLKYETGTPLAQGLSSVFIDRMFDMYLILPLGALGVVRFAVAGTAISWPWFGALCALLCLPLLLLHAQTARICGRALLGLPLWGARRTWLAERLEQFAQGLEVLTLTRVAACAFTTALAYLIFFFQCSCCARALGMEIGFVDLVLTMAAVNFISFVPISPSGLGTREACLTLFLARLNPPYAMAAAVTYGLVVFLVFFVGAGAIGFLCWQWAPAGMRQAVRRREA